MREKLKKWATGADIQCERTPFDGKKMIAVPMAYVSDLKTHIVHYLDPLDKKVEPLLGFA